MSLFPRLAIALLIIGVTTPPAQAIQRDITHSQIVGLRFETKQLTLTLPAD